MRLHISRTHLRWSIISVGFGLSVGMTGAALSYGGDASFVLGFLLCIVLCLAVAALGATYWNSEFAAIRDEIEHEVLPSQRSVPSAIEFPQKAVPAIVTSNITGVNNIVGSGNTLTGGSFSQDGDMPNASYDDDQYKWEKLDATYW